MAPLISGARLRVLRGAAHLFLDQAQVSEQPIPAFLRETTRS